MAFVEAPIAVTNFRWGPYAAIDRVALLVEVLKITATWHQFSSCTVVRRLLQNWRGILPVAGHQKVLGDQAQDR